MNKEVIGINGTVGEKSAIQNGICGIPRKASKMVLKN